jgi:hypothetical protein
MDQEKISSLARIAYSGYGTKAGWKAYNGEAMPTWDELPPHIRERWLAAINAVLVAQHNSYGA